MDLTDRVGLRQDQQVVVALLVVAVVLEPLAAEVRLAQPEPLDHRAHRAVEDEDLLRGALTQGVRDLGTVDGGEVGHVRSRQGRMRRLTPMPAGTGVGIGQDVYGAVRRRDAALPFRVCSRSSS